MRWYDLKAKNLQIDGTKPETGAVPVFFDEEDFHYNYSPEMGEPYFISEVKEGYEPGSRYLKVRDNIDKAKALIWDVNLEGTTIPSAFNKVIKEHIKAKPEMWV
jgi:hypothetical protein